MQCAKMVSETPGSSCRRAKHDIHHASEDRGFPMGQAMAICQVYGAKQPQQPITGSASSNNSKKVAKTKAKSRCQR